MKSHQTCPESPRRNGVSRRQFVKAGTLSAVGLGLSRYLQLAKAAGVSDAPCQSVILLWMQGGVSHLDTFDPKPDAPADIRGAFRAIKTNVAGIQLSEHLPGLAKVADKIAFVRGMHHPEGAHERGMSYMLSGYKPSPAANHPSIGSVVANELGRLENVPPYVAVPGTSFAAALGYLGHGHLDAAHAPLTVGSDPVSSNFIARDPQQMALASFAERTHETITSPQARAAFDLTKESDRVRDAYGRTAIGQKCLLARRLVESGVRFVTVDEDGWDHHFRAFDALERRLPPFDRAVSSLIRDLDSRGLLDSTMVVFATEFGRSPRVNREAGRDHWPHVFSTFLAGGGIKGGQAIGASDARGESPVGRAVTPEDLFCTVYHQLGINPHKQHASAQPLRIVDGGSVVSELV